MGVYTINTYDTTDRTQRLIGLVSGLNSIEGVTAVADSVDISSTTYDGASFSIDGTNIHGFFGYDTGLLHTGVALYNGIGENPTVLITPTAAGDSNIVDLVISSFIDEGFTLISVNDSSAVHGGIEVIVNDITSSIKLVGYGTNSTTVNIVDISTMVFEDVNDTSRVQYTYTNMFPYAATSGSLDFLSQAYLVNGGVRKFTSTFMKECSTVSLASTVSLTNPLGNHLAIGAHCLVQITQEGGNE